MGCRDTRLGLMPDNKIQSNALEITDVSHIYGHFQALKNISFKIKKGEFVVLLGPNGAGKTTLFSLITRLYSTQCGQISINEHDLNHQPYEALNHLGVVFQQRCLDLDLSALQNLKYSAALHGLSKHEAQQRAEKELIQVDMWDYRNHKIRTLSGGQARRIEIARALMTQPEILILDEATVGLDINSRRHLLEHVRSLSKLSQTAVLWTTHLIDELDPNDYMIVLKQGQIIEQCSVHEFSNKDNEQSIQQQLHTLLA